MTTTRREALAAAITTLGATAACATPSGPPSDLLDVDAVGLAALIRAKETSAAEAVEASLKRADALNPKLNAIVAATTDRARAAAKRAPSGPFAGVPTYIKDLDDVAGAPTSFGCRALANTMAAAQTPMIDAVLDSGLICLGKSTTPEFGFTATTEPLLGGATRNPWNLAHSSGGSSGGAAALVAAGVVPIAHASDGGGSIRIPASCCGLVGLKPSRGRTALTGRVNEEVPVAISQQLCVSRSVRDTAAFLAVVERTNGPHPSVGLVSGPSVKRLRIGFQINGVAGQTPDRDVAEATLAAAKTCEGLGHRVIEYAIPIDGAQFTEAFTLYWASGAAQTVDAISKAAGRAPDDTMFEPFTLGLVEYFLKNRAKTPAAIGYLQSCAATYAAMFADLDVILTPVLSSAPPEIGFLSPALPYDVSMPRVQAYVAYTPLSNAAGAPALSLPLGQSVRGLPIGAHFMARHGDERTLLELAYELEQAQPWATRRPTL